jgi:hypothetical protein
MVQPSNGTKSVNVSSLGGSVRADFSLEKQVSPWQNQVKREDVDNDQVVSALDVLVLINEINRNGARELGSTESPPPPYWDVNGNRFIEALDVLVVINYINSNLSGGGEGGGEGESLRSDPWGDIDRAFSDFVFGDSLGNRRRRSL